MSNVVQFPRHRIRDRASGIRAACIADRWCVEHLDQGIVTDRTFVPTLADARRVAARISRRDKVTLLTAVTSRPRPWSTTKPRTPDDAA
jgi:hypothetical protein